MNALRLTAWWAAVGLVGDAPAAEFSTIEVAGKKVTICRVNVRKEPLQFFHRDETGKPFKRFAISEAPVSFHEFATMFRDTLGCPDALFLDGTISSLFSSKLNRNDSRKDLGPMMGLTESFHRARVSE